MLIGLLDVRPLPFCGGNERASAGGPHNRGGKVLSSSHVTLGALVYRGSGEWGAEPDWGDWGDWGGTGSNHDTTLFTHTTTPSYKTSVL